MSHRGDKGEWGDTGERGDREAMGNWGDMHGGQRIQG